MLLSIYQRYHHFAVYFSGEVVWKGGQKPYVEEGQAEEKSKMTKTSEEYTYST